MAKRLNRFAAATVLGIHAVTGTAAWAQQMEPDWLEPLVQQLKAEEGCDVDYFLSYWVRSLEGVDYFEASARCRDGREYDAVRTDSEDRFSISACGTRIC